MSRKTVLLEIDAEHEDLRRQAAFFGAIQDLAAGAPDGSILDACEKAVIARGCDRQRLLLQCAAQARVEATAK